MSTKRDREIVEQIDRFLTDAFPLCRSITGDGVRQTLDLVEGYLRESAVLHDTEFKRIEVPTGTKVLDWEVPNEWNLKRATLDGPSGRVADTDLNNLHLVSYSVPTQTSLSLTELRPHLHSLPKNPTVIPYRTSYYKETWGFCLPHDVVESLPEGQYEVNIDTSLQSGALSYAELTIGGQGDDEFLLTTHICHPSMANDNLSGIVTVMETVRRLAKQRLNQTIRVLFIPGTIGSITWLEQNKDDLNRIKAGLVIAGAGDAAPPTYKNSRLGSTRIDLLMRRLVAQHGGTSIDYYPYGYDERQFCSPGFDLPVGRLSRSVHGTYPEYHTSADNLDFVDAATLASTINLVTEAILELDRAGRYVNIAPQGEPQLGRRGLYGAVGGSINSKSKEMALLWLLSYSDGEHSLDDIEQLSQIDRDSLLAAADALEDAGLLKSV